MSKSKQIFNSIREKQINSVVVDDIPSHIVESIKPIKKPKLKDFELPIKIDFTGLKAYMAYKKAKKEYINRKPNESSKN